MTKASTSICVIAIALAGAAGTCAARVVVRPIIPDTLDVPLNEDLTLQARAAGYQIYACTAKPDSTHYEWTLEAPEADLFDSAGRKIGRHYAGPTWELADGSKVGGKVRAHANAPEGKAPIGPPQGKDNSRLYVTSAFVKEALDKGAAQFEWGGRASDVVSLHLRLSPQELAEELGTRQQTISEWETGVYQPRGMSERLLGIIAERSSFLYGAPPDDEGAVDGGAPDG